MPSRFLAPNGLARAFVRQGDGLIPPLTLGGLLPPFVGASPATGGSISPYQTTLLEVAHHFATNEERRRLLRGLVDFRQALSALGIQTGAQWIDGSYCEECERLRGRPPSDIDLVTLFIRPSGMDDAALLAMATSNPAIFDRATAKKTYYCDPFWIDIGLPAYAVAPQITYWFGLFTHQRATFQWKGMLLVPLDAADDLATRSYLATLKFADEKATA